MGRQLLEQSGQQIKKLSLELGGSAPVLIFPDADVDQVAQQTVLGKFRNMGQVCIAATRFYVHESIFEVRPGMCTKPSPSKAPAGERMPGAEL